MTPAQVNAVVKTQGIRVLDVVLIGPLMLWGGLQLRKRHPVAGTALAVFGVSTVVYNARNYQIVKSGRVAQSAATSR